MHTRRDFLRTATAGTAGALLSGRSLARLAAQSRRRVTIGGRPVKVIDAHAHCIIPVTDIVQGSPLAKMGGAAGAHVLGPQRLQVMDEQGVDVQALEAPFLSDADKEAILSGNLRRLLRIAA
jgi:hypothetical protein